MMKGVRARALPIVAESAKQKFPLFPLLNQLRG